MCVFTLQVLLIIKLLQRLKSPFVGVISFFSVQLANSIDLLTKKNISYALLLQSTNCQPFSYYYCPQLQPPDPWSCSCSCPLQPSFPDFKLPSRNCLITVSMFPLIPAITSMPFFRSPVLHLHQARRE